MSEEWAVNNTVTKNIQDLIEYDSNPREHAPEQIQQVAESIKEFGWTMPILIDETNEIIAGHGRLLAGKQLGIQKVPCIIAKGWSEEQKKAYCIADNKLTENSTWSKDLLKLNLTDLYDQEFDLRLTGFSEDELSGLLPDLNIVDGLTDEDDVPEVSEEPVTKNGDVWICGEHKVMCGDSTSINAVKKLIEGLKPNVVFTDPPYGIGLDKENQKLGKSKSYGAVLNDHNSEVAKYVFQLVSKLDIPELYFWGANHYSSCLPDASCWIVWDKQGGKSVTYADCELCYTNIEKPVRMFTHIWDGFRKDSEKGEVRFHPTQKPVALFIDIWDKFNSGQVILDLFGGSGSTLIACEKTNRKCYMMELEPKYCDVIVKRWQNYTGKEAIYESNGAKFNELLK